MNMHTDPKKRKRRKTCIRRTWLLIITALTAISIIIVLCMIGKAVLIVGEVNHMLPPLLLTMLGITGALAKLAEWLIEKEPK